MKDQAKNCERRDAKKAKRDNLILNLASFIGACGFIYAMAIAQNAVVAL